MQLNFNFSYILSYRVSNKVKNEAGGVEVIVELPRFKTIEGVKSHIKMACMKLLKMDITDKIEFPEESDFWKDYLTHLKSNSTNDMQIFRIFDYDYFSGKMKIDHHKSVSPYVLDAAYQLFGDATAAYKARGQADYKQYLAKIPKEWRDKYHYLIQWGVMWFSTLLEINRGREVFYLS